MAGPSVNPVVFEIAPADPDGEDAATAAVLSTEVGTLTTPSMPVTVKVRTAPGAMARPVPFHSYLVPVPGTETGLGMLNPEGWDVLALTITGETVSVKSMPVMVATPLLVTTTWYVTSSPIPGEAGVWFRDTVKLAIGGWTVYPTGAP
jgi:hypothetical protein